MASIATNAPPARDQLSADEMREDLGLLRDVAGPRDLSFSAAALAAFAAHVEACLQLAGERPAGDFALDVMQAMALAGNGHSRAMTGWLLGDLPLRLWWFADGLAVVSAHPAQAHLLGARISHFGSLEAEAAQAALAPYLPGTAQRQRHLGPSLLASPAALRRIGATADPAAAPVRFTLADGRAHAETLTAVPGGDPNDAHTPAITGWSALIPAAPDLAGRWPHLLDGVRRPLTYAPATDASATWLPGGLLYVRSNFVNSLDATPLDRKLMFDILEAMLVPADARGAVVDLRLNNGGNFLNTVLFCQALPNLLPEAARIAVLVGRSTFSAALVTAAMLRANGGARVRLLGEAMGDASRFWAEQENFTLPHSGILVCASRGLHDWGAGAREGDGSYWPARAFRVRDISLAPDETIVPTSADYAAGHDPVLDRAITWLGGD